MKKIQNFLLFTARENFQILVMAFVFGIPLCLVALIASLGLSSETLRFSWAPTIIFILAFADLMIVGAKITAFSSKSTRTIIIYQNGGFEIYKKPIWGKFDYNMIYFPKDFSFSILKNVGCNIQVSFEVEVEARKIILPFRLNFKPYEMLDVWDLHEMLLLQGDKIKDKKVFLFNECIQNLFVKYNLEVEKNRMQIENLAIKLLDSGKDRDFILESINKIVYLPDNLFPATISTQIIKNEVKIIMFDHEQFH